MVEIELPSDLADYEGRLIERSGPAQIDQGMIDRFADLTGDHDWIHVGRGRAAKEMPDGKLSRTDCSSLRWRRRSRTR